MFYGEYKAASLLEADCTLMSIQDVEAKEDSGTRLGRLRTRRRSEDEDEEGDIGLEEEL